MTQPTTLEQELSEALLIFRGLQPEPEPIEAWGNFQIVLLSLFEKYATEIIGDNEHIQHFSFHGRSDIRDELRKEQTQRLKQILPSVRKDD